MLFEDIMLLLLIASGVFLIGIPIYKLAKYIVPKKRNPLIESKEKLEQARLGVEAARLEVEVARLDKEREKLYNKMYEEALQEDEVEIQQEKRK